MANFQEAVNAKDLDAIEEMLADDVVFRSPVAHKPYPGKAVTISILRAVVEVFEDFHYVRQIENADGKDAAYVFKAKVNNLEITGCDFLQFNDEGKISEFTVMVRPLKAAQALADRMAERFPEIQANAIAWMEQHHND